MAIAHDAVAAGIVTEPVELAQDLSNFELKSALEKLTSTFARQLVERGGWTVKRAVSNFGHWRTVPFWMQSYQPQGTPPTSLIRPRPQLSFISPWPLRLPLPPRADSVRLQGGTGAERARQRRLVRRQRLLLRVRGPAPEGVA